MKFTELKASLENPLKIYLLEGEESFFRDRGVELIKSRFLIEPDLNLTNLNGAALKSDLSPLIAALPVCPFLGDYRVIVVTEWYPTVSDFKNGALSAFFNSDLASTIVVISNKSKCDALKKQKSVTTVDCGRAELSVISRYLQAKAREAQLIISRQNCEMIAEYCNYDMSKINVEIEKLISYCIGNAEIDSEAINLLVVKETDYKIYETVNFIALKQFDKAYSALGELADLGNEQVLLVSLYYHFRRLLLISTSNKSDAQIASLLGVKDYAVKKCRQQARAFSPKTLMSITKALADYDAKFKSGEMGLKQAVDNAAYMIMTIGA